MKADDGGRGWVFRPRGWYVRIFGADCGVVLTPPLFSHKVYLRWALGQKRPDYGLIFYRDDDGEPTARLGLGRLFGLDVTLPEYVERRDAA